jgi:hypothetical protein
MMVVTLLSYMKKNPKFNILNSKVNFIPLPSSIKNKFGEVASFLETQALGITRSLLLYDTKGSNSRLVFIHLVFLNSNKINMIHSSQKSIKALILWDLY